MSFQNRPRYSFKDNGGSSQSQEFGNYILKRGAGEIRNPSWNRTETVVRILPQWDFEANRWHPFRYSRSPMDFGDWIRRYDAVRGFGANGVTFLLYDPIANPTYDIQSNPCVMLYRAINQAIENRQEEPGWAGLLKGGPGKRAQLSRHTPIYITRCGIFRINNKDMATDQKSPLGLGDTDASFFMLFPKTAGEKLINMLEEVNEDYSGDPEDYDAVYKNGDIVSLERGGYLHIFEEGADPRQNQAYKGGPRQLPVGGGGRGNYGGGGGGGKGSTFTGYDMYVSKEWNGFQANLDSPELAKIVKAKQRPWEDCLQFYSHQEQAFLVQDGFPASAVLYAWRDHPEWIKDETRAKAVNRVSGMVSNNVPQGRDNPPAWAQQQEEQAPVTTMPRTPTPTGRPAGGWGSKPASDTEEQAPTQARGTERDSVVPSGLTDDVDTASVDAITLNNDGDLKSRAQAALAAANSRVRFPGK